MQKLLHERRAIQLPIFKGIYIFFFFRFSIQFDTTKRVFGEDQFFFGKKNPTSQITHTKTQFDKLKIFSFICVTEPCW